MSSWWADDDMLERISGQSTPTRPMMPPDVKRQRMDNDPFVGHASLNIPTASLLLSPTAYRRRRPRARFLDGGMIASILARVGVFDPPSRKRKVHFQPTSQVLGMVTVPAVSPAAPKLKRKCVCLRP